MQCAVLSAQSSDTQSVLAEGGNSDLCSLVIVHVQQEVWHVNRFWAHHATTAPGNDDGYALRLVAPATQATSAACR
jgi:hypothetical protein